MIFHWDYSLNNKVFDECSKIRQIVFCGEQKATLEEEIDEYDVASYHVIGLLDEKPVACARIVKKNDGWYLGRIAVLKEYRGQGLATKMVQFLEEFTINNMKVDKIYLNAQKTAIKLYENVGFKIVSNEFYEAGIKHFKMEKIYN